jgi:peptidyl-tRNA hydrolase, PTH2 family
MYKQAIVIRCDITMSLGKTAVQASHASFSAAIKVPKTRLQKWQKEGQKKIVLKANLGQLKELEIKCKKAKIEHALISDAGLTELLPGTITALGIGPEKGELIDKITGSLPLLD